MAFVCQETKGSLTYLLNMPRVDCDSDGWTHRLQNVQYAFADHMWSGRALDCQFHECAAAPKSGIHCLIVCAIQLLTQNNLDGTWRRICSPEIRSVSALEMLRDRVLQIDIYLLTCLTFDLLAQNSNLFHLHRVNLVKFLPAVCKISSLKTFSIRSHTEARTDSSKRMPSANHWHKSHYKL